MAAAIRDTTNGHARSRAQSFNSSGSTPVHARASLPASTANGKVLESYSDDFTTKSSIVPKSFLPEVHEDSSIMEKFQVEVYIMAMRKQLQSVGKRGFFARKPATLEGHDMYGIEDMLCFQREPIPTSLLRISNHLISRAVKLFQIVLRYTTTDIPGTATLNSQEQVSLVTKLYTQTLKCSELRDELFAQIFKQSRNNPYRHFLVKTWELLYLCASAMPPSKELGLYLLEYVHTVANDQRYDHGIQLLAFNTWKALKCTMKAGPRHTTPVHEEIEALISGQRLTTTIYFIDETSMEINYDMRTTISNAIEELAASIKLLSYNSFGLFAWHRTFLNSKSSDSARDEHLGLDENRYVGDLVLEFKMSKNRRKGEPQQSWLLFKKRVFPESDEAITESVFLHLSYIQLQHDYILGYYPVRREDAVQLAALQIVVKMGLSDDDAFNGDWTTMVEQCLPRHFAVAQEKNDWEFDLLSCYREMDHLSKDDAKQHFIRILRSLPYGNAAFFNVRKMEDPIGLLPGSIILGVNRNGLHFLRPVPKEYLHSAELRDIMQFGSSTTAVFIKMRVAGVLHVFQFETNEGEDICVALQTHINDVMLRRCSKTQFSTNAAFLNTEASAQPDMKPPGIELYEKHVEEMSKVLEESCTKADKLTEELRLKEQKELALMEEVQALKDGLSKEQKVLSDVIEERQNLQKLLEEKEAGLQVAMAETTVAVSDKEEEQQDWDWETKQIKKHGSFRICAGKRVRDLPSFDKDRALHMFENQAKELRSTLKLRNDELLLMEENYGKLVHDKQLLEQTLNRFEKQRIDELNLLEKNFEQERQTFKLQLIEMEKKLFDQTQDLSASQSSLALCTREVEALRGNIQELDNLREMKEDLDRKDAQSVEMIKWQANRISELETLYKDEQVLRKRYYNLMEDMKGKIRVYARWRPLVEKEMLENQRTVIWTPDEFTVEHPWKDNKSKQYQFDHVFDDQASQEEIFEDTKYLVQSAVDGYNVCIFAYGQTGSGKTFTIYGTDDNPGLIPRAARELFHILKRERKKILSSMKGMVVVENATLVTIFTRGDLDEIVAEGLQKRHTCGTNMNAESSRSHVVLSIIIESTNSQTQTLVKGKLSFVDLAGSERIKKSGSAGEQLKEAQSINKSLSALGDVISALAMEEQHIPYRNHKLTMLMSDSLGGNAKTLMFVNVAPTESNLLETHNSLSYATRVRSITNDPTKNTSSKEIIRLKKQIGYWREQAGKKIDEEELDEIQDRPILKGEADSSF
ncbi:hypothetical protein O6H91_23G054700 [Diphasiastrum complanatum]|uniref:Uncharacterized protein n=1 Tax=Diphasiastrum complanatum TaxID=34168 RepID=A0ACC2AAT3_DIPCM|nr:hypothetical protein O6H91_23G054700 [Diphasiastrum complanatum]